MNNLLEKLKGGTLISDGSADRVADQVLANPLLFDKLLEGLNVEEDIIRARAAHGALAPGDAAHEPGYERHKQQPDN